MKVMGIDLGISKIAWAVWEDDVLVETGAFADSVTYRPKVLHRLGEEIWAQVAKHEPDFIFIEDTLIGNNRKYSIRLSQTMGAVLAQLSDQSVNLVNVSTWKKTVLGNGRADKQMVQKYMCVTHPAYSELCGNDQDRFDAACIGYYGVLIERRARIPLTG